ncbi:MAG: DegV family protein [Clostridia bacterium]|nr:DegV family protein [Clostridia bacterium]
MVRIISDTSTLYSTTQAREAGFDVSALSVHIAGKSYREFDEISSEEFVSIIQQGHMPTSSQPAIGEVIELYEKYPDDEILNITMADGLSGTYKSAVGALEMCSKPDHIKVINSRTLCGPHRYIVEEALRLAKEGAGMEKILERCRYLIDSAKSFLLPADFGYQRRGGRLSPLVSYVGQAMKLAPVLTQTEDSLQLTIAGVRRSFTQAVKFVGNAFVNYKAGKGWRVYVSHAGVPEMAEQALRMMKEALPTADHFEILPLSPAFITQGGPGCVAIQVVRS